MEDAHLESDYEDRYAMSDYDNFWDDGYDDEDSDATSYPDHADHGY